MHDKNTLLFEKIWIVTYYDDIRTFNYIYLFFLQRKLLMYKEHGKIWKIINLFKINLKIGYFLKNIIIFFPFFSIWYYLTCYFKFWQIKGYMLKIPDISFLPYFSPKYFKSILLEGTKGEKLVVKLYSGFHLNWDIQFCLLVLKLWIRIEL